MTCDELQPFSPDRMRPKTSRLSAAVKLTKPHQSGRRAPRCTDSETLARVSTHGADAERQVDEEDPPPGQTGGERAAEQRPDGDGQSGDRTPDPERDAALPTGEGAGQQGQGDGEHDGAADALRAAGQDQHQR